MSLSLNLLRGNSPKSDRAMALNNGLLARFRGRRYVVGRAGLEAVLRIGEASAGFPRDSARAPSADESPAPRGATPCARLLGRGSEFDTRSIQLYYSGAAAAQRRMGDAEELVLMS
jgi:hypothetical protein